MKELATIWCSMVHDAPMWPIHGHYACRVCGREYSVEWSNASRATRAMQSDSQAFQPAVLEGR